MSLGICKMHNSKNMLHKMIADCSRFSNYFYLGRLSELQKENSDIRSTVLNQSTDLVRSRALKTSAKPRIF